ncbi:hypothetical protein SLS64_010754 [Diaporthe eres]|uniref:RING-type domain-containing protein n=1 Tax=Diaporthe eres TaxID=83184 RepID=A0ABR1NNT9_DIAER
MSSPRATPSRPVESRKRKHSDISGVDADRPVKKSRYSAEEEDTNLWTTVKSYLENPAGRPQPMCYCPICMYPIAIRGVPVLEPDPWKLADGSQKVGGVLPCAHIICLECINGHFVAQEELVPGHKSCPICRANCKFGCLHTIPPQRLPIATGEDASLVPLTMPELQPGSGHRLPADCFECTGEAAEEYVDVGLRFVSEVVHGVGYLPGEGPQEWENLVEASLQLMWDYLENQRAIPSWRNGSVPAGLLRVSFVEDAADLPQLSDPHYSDAIVYSREGEAFWCVPVHRGDGPF